MVKAAGKISPVAEKVRNFFGEEYPISDKKRLLVAVSGGPDSVCLLHVLAEMQKEFGLDIHVAHLNHQLRGTESEDDARYVLQLAQKLNIPADVENRDVEAYRKEHRISKEEAAREVRYNFLVEVAKSVNADVIAVGHTADDNIETVLLHLVRGSGTRGLRGLQPENRWKYADDILTVIRPLIRVNRRDILRYCFNHHLFPRIDTSNLSVNLLRNNIRQNLLPLMLSYNHQAGEALLRMASIAGTDIDYLDGESEKLLSGISSRHGDTIALDRAMVLELPVALQRYLLQAAIRELVGNIKDIEWRHIEDMMSLLDKPAGKRVDLPGGLNFTTEYSRYLLGFDTADLIPFPILEKECEVKIPGETIIPGWKIDVSVILRAQVKDDDNEYRAYLDFDKIDEKITMRAWKTGDRFQPLGMSQFKKMGKFMIDQKIPRNWRDRIPVVCSQGKILWLVGWRIDDRVKVTGDTTKVLVMEFKQT